MTITRDAIQSALDSSCSAAAKLARLYCSSQIEEWQRVPWLALMAYDPQEPDWLLQLCFADGLYLLTSGYEPSSIKEAAFVDLATGELVPHPEGSLATRQDTLQLPDHRVLGVHRKELRVLSVIDKLERRAANLTRAPAPVHARYRNWHRDAAERHGLSANQPYTRTASLWETRSTT